MRNHTSVLVLAAILATGCSLDVSESPSPSDPEQLSVAVAEVSSRSVVLAEFDFSYDAVTGEERFDVRPPTQTEYVSADGTIRQALGFCNDFGTNIGSSGEFRIDTVASTVGTTAAECIPAAGLLDWGTLFYNEGGAFCATIRVENQSGGTIENVTAEIAEITAGYEGYRYRTTPAGTSPCCGTGADLSAFSGQNAPSDLAGGAFLHGSLADGTSADRAWTFRNAGGSFAFSGRLVGAVPEIDNGLDDDCDGRADNALNEYSDGDECAENADCVSGFCESIEVATGFGVCAVTCPVGTYGVDCTECPGGLTNICSGNGECADGAAGAGDCDCDPGWGSDACNSCATGFFGATCAPCVDCGANGACNDGVGGAGGCLCADGYHGATCQFSCSDGSQNGDEEGLDCGGSECDACATGGVTLDCGANGTSVDGTIVYAGGPALPCDPISDTLCITRGSSEPLFNSTSESRYSGSASPAGTTWARGTCDAPISSFSSFINTMGYCPPCRIPGDFCLRETASGAETDIGFTSWQSGGGGAFSYTRAGATCECDTGYHGARCQFSCTDGIQNGDEAAIDCGGSECGVCPPGSQCNFRGTLGTGTVSFTHANNTTDCDQITPDVCINRSTSQPLFNSDAESGWSNATPSGTLWARGTCAAPSTTFDSFVSAVGACPPCHIPGNFCLRTTSNGNEYDIDFRSWQVGGGGGFSYVRTGEACVCEAPYVGATCAFSCSDSLLNGDEQGVDCGGSCAATCADGTACEDASDCTSNYCHPTTALCVTPTCSDGLMNGLEENIDCGVTACGTVCTDVGFGCADHQLGSTIGTNILTGSTAGQANEIQATCAAGQNGGDFTVNWLAPETRTYEFTLDGSSYDSAINIRSGALGPICTNSAPEIACQDDFNDLQPNLLFATTAGTWYLIVIDGYSSSSGNFVFSIIPR